MTPPIQYLADLVPDSARLLARALGEVVWDESQRARMTASFGVPYNYSQMSYPAVEMPDWVSAIAALVQAKAGFAPNNCLLNRYDDGRSTMGFHSDDTDILVEGTGVAIVSLGAERDIVFRLKAAREVESRLTLASGSMLYMSDAVQAQWLHAIPKSEGTGPRISMTFRAIRPEAARP